MLKNPIVLSLILIVFISLFFVGLWGENDHADDLINNYFLELKDGKFNNSCIPISINGNKISNVNEIECSQNNFIFNLSLLEYFEQQGNDEYIVNLNKNHFWIPYVTKDILKISLNLTNEPVGSFELFDDSKYISDIFIIKRNKLSWKIHEANLTDPKLIKIFNRLKQNINFNKYIKITSQGFIFNNITINRDSLSELDKQLIKYNIQQVSDFLDINGDKAL